MKTENVLSTVTVARTGTLQTVRVIDFEKLAAQSEDGRVDVAALTSGGDWCVRFTPVGRDAEPVMYEQDGAPECEAFVAGFVANADSRTRGPREGGDDFDPTTVTNRAQFAELATTKAKICSIAKHIGVEYKANETKGVIATRVAKKLPSK